MSFQSPSRIAPCGEPPWFDFLDEGYSYPEMTSQWATHYSRAIENQLDFAHYCAAFTDKKGST